MHPPDLEIRVRDLLAAAHERIDGATDAEYQHTFEDEGGRKSSYIIEDLLTREKRGDLSTDKLIYLCIGGADGSEVEHVLSNTDIRQAIMVEISEGAANAARQRAKRVFETSGKRIQVIEGDITAKLQYVSDKLGACKLEYGLTGIVCSAQAVLHELPRRSPNFNFSVFLGKIYHDPSWETVAFYSREPCRPTNWPEIVQVRVKDLSGELLCRFALHVASRLGLPQQGQDLAHNWVRVSGILAVESLHKLLRNDTVRKINYELEEQLTEFDPVLIGKILRDYVPNIDVSIEPITTDGFKEALELHHVEFLDSNHNHLSIPLTHVRIIGIRTIPSQTNKIPANTPGPPDVQKENINDANNSKARVHSNLGAPPYSRFISRDQPFSEIMDGLRGRTSPVLVSGTSGVGKTSLAHEVVTSCLAGVPNCPGFDAVVWISDKANPGSTSLSAVLDEIALTMDYAGLTQLELPEKRRRIEELARSQKILIVIDSFETVVDSSLSTWLCNIPEPSKALVTIIKNGGKFPSTVTDVDVPGMNEQETREFVEHRLSTLKLASRVKDYSTLEPLLTITEGNAKAIETGLGIITHKKRPLSEVVDDLAKAKPPFDDFRSDAWALLDPKARMLLLTTYYFPYGTQAGPLKRVAQVSDTDFDRSIDPLSDLSLLDVMQSDLESVPTYTTHGLVRAFVKAKLNDDPINQTLLLRNWLAWLREIVAGIGLCWNDIGRLSILDDQGLRQTILLAIDWSFQYKEYASTIAIARDVRYYFYVRGFWSVDINLRRARAAELSGDMDEEFAALTYHVNITSKQGNLAGIEPQIQRLAELVELQPMSEENIIGYHHALALYSLAKGDYVDAERAWLANLAKIERAEYPHEYSANTRWLAVCLEKQGRIPEVHQLLDKALAHAREMNFTRGVVDIVLKQATLYLGEQRYAEAETKLKEIAPQLQEVQDRLYDAQYAYVEGRVSDASGREAEAKALYEIALDAFERLGLNDRAIDTKAALADVIERLHERGP